MKTDLPIERLHDLAKLSDAGDEAKVVATADELARLAQWAGVEAITRFEAKVTLARLAQGRFRYTASFEADVVQSCVVTLEPVDSRIARTFSRSLHYVPGTAAERAAPLALASADDDTPEEIGSLRFDLTGPLLEEFSLALDPYPRAPGVAFEPTAELSDRPESPFAVLKGFKRG